MDVENIIEQLKPIDYHRETNCLTLVFENNVVIFFRDWDDGEIMWHVFDNKQSIEAGVDEEDKILKILKSYLDNRFAAKKE